MLQELIYTSAPRGLQLGKSGFCTVASTPAMPQNLAKFLESLSGYRHVVTAGSPGNPTVYSYLRAKLGGEEFFICSRIADAGLDYSQRSNKLAHHLASNRLADFPGGPTDWFFAGEFCEVWNREPETLTPRQLSSRGRGAVPCPTWRTLTGDAGWAGVVAEALWNKRQAFLVVDPGQPALGLVDEVLRLFPERDRWQYPFSTFVANLPPTVTCQLRCVLAGSPEVALARRSPAHLIIDLTGPLVPPTGRFVDAARRGETLELAAPPSLRSGAPTLPNRPEIAPAAHAMGDNQLELLPDDSSEDGFRIAPPSLSPPTPGRQPSATPSAPPRHSRELRRKQNEADEVRENRFWKWQIAIVAALLVAIGTLAALPFMGSVDLGKWQESEKANEIKNDTPQTDKGNTPEKPRRQQPDPQAIKNLISTQKQIINIAKLAISNIKLEHKRLLKGERSLYYLVKNTTKLTSHLIAKRKLLLTTLDITKNNKSTIILPLYEFQNEITTKTTCPSQPTLIVLFNTKIIKQIQINQINQTNNTTTFEIRNKTPDTEIGFIKILQNQDNYTIEFTRKTSVSESEIIIIAIEKTKKPFSDPAFAGILPTSPIKIATIEPTKWLEIYKINRTKKRQMQSTAKVIIGTQNEPRSTAELSINSNTFNLSLISINSPTIDKFKTFINREINDIINRKSTDSTQIEGLQKTLTEINEHFALIQLPNVDIQNEAEFSKEVAATADRISFILDKLNQIQIKTELEKDLEAEKHKILGLKEISSNSIEFNPPFLLAKEDDLLKVIVISNKSNHLMNTVDFQEELGRVYFEYITNIINNSYQDWAFFEIR